MTTHSDAGYLLYCAYRPTDGGVPTPPPDCETIEAGDLGVIARRIDDVRQLQEPDRDDLIAFQEGVAAIFAERTVVPFRWGSVARTRQDVSEMLSQDGALWRDQLDRLDGLVEMGVRRWLPRPQRPAPSSKAPRSGADYLARRKEAIEAQMPWDERHPAVTEILDLLGDWVARLELSHSQKSDALFGGSTLSIALLVPRDAVSEVEDAFEAARPFEHGERTELSGPWPPYSFV